MRRPPATVALPAICFAVFAGLSALFLFRAEVLYDTDSYFHLFVARVYRELGVVDEFPWTRFSIYRDGFGDKELLFHLLLAPFAGGGGSTAGGRLATALLVGAIAAALGALGQRAIGPWGALAPAIVFFGSIDFLGRAIRLRPELLALLLFLAAAWCAAERRYRTLGLVAFVFALSYTGFHALVALCGLWFVYSWIFERRREWLLLLYPVLGTGLGLLAHPHFPHNLVVWKVQNVDFFLLASQLDVSSENRPPALASTVRDNWGWLAACAALWLGRGWLARNAGGPATNAGGLAKNAGGPATNASGPTTNAGGLAKNASGPATNAGGPETTSPGPARDTAELAVFTVAAAAFAVLYLPMLRFSTYFYSFGALALLYAIRRFPALPPRGPRRVAAAAALALALAFTVLPARMLWGMATATGGALSREADWAAAGKVLPAGARVAADWGLTPNVLYFAPHALFLNVLNSVFMAVPHPDEYRVWREVIEGRSNDPVGAVRAELESDYLVLSRFFTHPRLLERLDADPRAHRLYAGYTLVYRLDAAAAAPALERPTATEPANRAPSAAP